MTNQERVKLQRRAARNVKAGAFESRANRYARKAQKGVWK